MDNASKALIMAGAILISIAIVGVGVFIFSSTSSITNSGQQQLDAAAAQTANSTIRQYTGERVRGSTVREFGEYVRVLNTNQTFPKKIEWTGVSGDATANAFYEVTASDTDADSYYDQINVDNAY